MCKSYTKRMIASQSCCSKLSPSGQCGCLCPAYDAVCNKPADLRRLRPKLPQVGTKPSNLQSRRWASIYIEIFIFIRHIVRYCTRAYQDCLCRTIRRNSMAEVGQWPPLSIQYSPSPGLDHPNRPAKCEALSGGACPPGPCHRRLQHPPRDKRHLHQNRRLQPQRHHLLQHGQQPICLKEPHYL